jgi:hypothetical protein
MEYRADLRNKKTTIKTIWENHIPPALGMYPTRLSPKDSWFTKRVSKWEAETPYEEIPEDPIVKPWDRDWWDKDWGENPSRISVMTALFGHAQEVLEGQDENYRLEGFPKRVCAWAIRLSEFFDVSVRRECLFLLKYAYRFEKEERIRLISHDPSEDKIVSDEALEDLIRWQQYKAGNLIRPKRKYEHRQYKGPHSEPEITEIEESYIWERTEAELEIDLALNIRGATAFQTHGDGETELLVDGKWIPISIKPTYQEEPEVVEEALLDGAYRVISMATTDQMIMPVDIPREEFREPPPEIAAAFAETFAQARVRVAKEEAERAAATGDSQNSLTQDAVLKLVSELVEDPGMLSRERAAKLGMELVATFDEILNRHVGEQEGENN